MPAGRQPQRCPGAPTTRNARFRVRRPRYREHPCRSHESPCAGGDSPLGLYVARTLLWLSASDSATAPERDEEQNAARRCYRCRPSASSSSENQFGEEKRSRFWATCKAAGPGDRPPSIALACVWLRSTVPISLRG
ncbi:hypothetical protein MTO96_049099 [Rhipicephalus appendiculatus]